ncbi:MAG: hypothetical protein QG670_1516 [Thermoproteota archaeon]|nr:hypothetical protein [Thermoproteota archaeon]
MKDGTIGLFIPCHFYQTGGLLTSLAPFVPTPIEIVKKMLEIASVRQEDTVFDIGCGDGRILIIAIKDFNAKKAVGFEIREDLYNRAMQEVKKQGLEDRISIVNGNALDGDISEATVITLYLTTFGNEKLKPKLGNEACMGTRIISHSFVFSDWHLSKSEVYFEHKLYLYTIPEALLIQDTKPSLLKRLNPF